jgi:hypothetical protein
MTLTPSKPITSPGGTYPTAKNARTLDPHGEIVRQSTQQEKLPQSCTTPCTPLNPPRGPRSRRSQKAIFHAPVGAGVQGPRSVSPYPSRSGGHNAAASGAEMGRFGSASRGEVGGGGEAVEEEERGVVVGGQGWRRSCRWCPRGEGGLRVLASGGKTTDAVFGCWCGLVKGMMCCCWFGDQEF